MRRVTTFVLAWVLAITTALSPGLAWASEGVDVGGQEPALATDPSGKESNQAQGVDGSRSKDDAVAQGEGQEEAEEKPAEEDGPNSNPEHLDEVPANVDGDVAKDSKDSEEALQEEADTPAVLQTVQEGTLSAEAATVPNVEYVAHVQNIGWQKSVTNGAVAGTSGRGLRVEALRIWLKGLKSGQGGLEYRMHVQNKGWLDWVRDGALGGTSGKGLRTEAFQLRLYGKAAEQYDVWYRVHAQNVGWMAWAKNGELSGSEGRGLRLEAVQIRIVAHNTTPQGLESSNVSYAFLTSDGSSAASSGDIRITTHVQNIGWRTAVGGGATAGSTGKGLRLEAFRINTSDPVLSKGLTYRTHVQNIGWQDWQAVGGTAGTTGRGLRIEALQIELDDEAAQKYDVYYRAHVQNVGWMAWAEDGEMAGSLGMGYRCEAIQIRIVPKGQKIQLPSSGYRGAVINASARKPPKLSIKLVPQLQHGTKPFGYQRCIVMHDTTEYRPFDYWIDAWIRRGGSGTHFMVKEDGSIRQYADLNQICWHAGGAAKSGLDAKFGVVAYKANAGSAMNQCSIGIEIDHVIDGRGYPEAQLDAIDALIAYIDEYYGFQSTILQHKDYHTTNGDCSAQFQGYLRNLQRHRTTR